MEITLVFSSFRSISFADALTQMFSGRDFFWNTFSYRTPLVAVSDHSGDREVFILGQRVA